MRFVTIIKDRGPTTYTHDPEGHSEEANAIADELVEILDRFAVEAYDERLRQVQQGTAPAIPWQFNIARLAYGSMCANSMDKVYVEQFDPRSPCPVCNQVHPMEPA